MNKSEVTGVGEIWHGSGSMFPRADETPIDPETCRNEEMLMSGDPRHYSVKLDVTMKELRFILKKTKRDNI